MRTDVVDPLVVCVCCESGNLRASPYRDEFLGGVLRVCGQCGHLQVAALPSLQALRAHYAGAYAARRKAYLGPAYDRIMLRRAAAQLELIAAAGAAPPARLIDIGCGHGALLAAARRRGFEASGLDYDPAAVESCRQRGVAAELIVDEGTIAARCSPARIATMSHVLEHFRHPDQILHALRGPGRLLFVEVPCYDLGMPEQFADTEGHLHFFNVRSLAELLRRCGWRTLALERQGPSQRLFWSRRWRVSRALLRRVTGDTFFGQYRGARTDGIWIRATAVTS